MRCNPLVSRPFAIAAFALVLSSCNGTGGLPNATISALPAASHAGQNSAQATQRNSNRF